MPASVAALLNVFDSLILSIEAFGVPLSCLQLGSFFDQLLFLVLSPGVLVLLTLVCRLGIEVCTKREAASLETGFITALPYLLYILFFAFPLVSSRAIQALDCEEFDEGRRFLRVDYSLDCNDAEYRRVFFLACLAVTLYPVGVPLLYLTLLLCARKAILTEQPTALSRSLTFLHQDYELSMYWWEMVEIFKKARGPMLYALHHYCNVIIVERGDSVGAWYHYCPRICQQRAHTVCVRSAAVPSGRLRALRHPPRLHGPAHHWLRVLTSDHPLHIDCQTIPTRRA
jgi:hypothetical protein